jgi:hypothetical protein
MDDDDADGVLLLMLPVKGCDWSCCEGGGALGRRNGFTSLFFVSS